MSCWRILQFFVVYFIGKQVVLRKTGNVLVNAVPVGSKSVPVEGQATLESENIRSNQRKDTLFFVLFICFRSNFTKKIFYSTNQGSVGATTKSQYIPSEVWKEQSMEVKNIILIVDVVLKRNDTTI